MTGATIWVILYTMVLPVGGGKFFTSPSVMAGYLSKERCEQAMQNIRSTKSGLPEWDQDKDFQCYPVAIWR